MATSKDTENHANCQDQQAEARRVIPESEARRFVAVMEHKAERLLAMIVGARSMQDRDEGGDSLNPSMDVMLQMGFDELADVGALLTDFKNSIARLTAQAA